MGKKRFCKYLPAVVSFQYKSFLCSLLYYKFRFLSVRSCACVISLCDSFHTAAHLFPEKQVDFAYESIHLSLCPHPNLSSNSESLFMSLSLSAHLSFPTLSVPPSPFHPSIMCPQGPVSNDCSLPQTHFPFSSVPLLIHPPLVPLRPSAFFIFSRSPAG